MAAVKRLVARYELGFLRTGEYGTPPSWRPWLAQLLVWGLIGLAAQLIPSFTLIVPFYSQLGRFAAWLETPLLPYPHVELLIVMVVDPVILNVISVIIFDNIVKRKFVQRREDEHLVGAVSYDPSRALNDPLVCYRDQSINSSTRSCQDHVTERRPPDPPTPLRI